MEAHPTEEGSETVRVLHPLVRVNIWHDHRPAAWNLEAWLLRGCADIEEALAWARRQAEGRPFEILASLNEYEETETLIRLFGDNPNIPS